ncbi:NAD(P)/FAD-dependent oxidoreductase [Aquamicrobium soli]|uniref:NAD(P)/FAD-dependent oxidoreductase n=1 Tax=Aquamicrobium soli TaxID=1811518 RepID=A0ABV7K804_9HYPH
MDQLERSHGLWKKTAPPAPVTTSLEGDRSVDVAIVGAGFTGLSAALHLAQRGVKVAVLDAEDIGFGGSGRNVGLVNAGMWVMPNDVPKALGVTHGERLLNVLGNAPDEVFDLIGHHGIECEAERQGTLHCAVGQSGLEEIRQRAEQWQARGAPVRVLDAAETAAKTGSASYSGALLDLRAGTIQPLAYVRGLASAAMAAGAEIFTHTQVKGVQPSKAGWTLVTPGALVKADWVVIATNAYTHGLWPELRNEITHLPYFNFATAPLDAQLLKQILPERQGAWDTKEILSSFRLDRAGRLIFGSVGALRGTGAGIHEAWARRGLRRLFPQLDGVKFESSWYGMIGMTDNSLPKFHRLAPNVVAFHGYNGRGIGTGTVFGRLLSDHICGAPEADLPLPPSKPATQRFRAGRERFYELGAQLAHFVSGRF